jgi:hypothetical protein
VISVVGSPRVFAVRSAITAAPRMKRLLSSSARWNPSVSAAGRATCSASSVFVHEVATAEKIASPSAAPTWNDALISALA